MKLVELKTMALFVASCGMLAGCSQHAPEGAGDRQAEKIVNFFIWADDMAPDTIANFESRTGLKVNVSYFDSPETLEARMLAGHSGFDVVVPTEAFVKRHIQSGAYLPLDKSKLPNLANLDPAIMARVASQDPGNAHGVVYTWGTFGLGYNKKLVTQALSNEFPHSWRLIFDPAYASKLSSCGINIFDDPEAVVREALIYLARDPNSPTPADFDDVENVLRRIRPYVRNIDTSSDIQALANGDVCVALAYNGNVVQARKRAKEAGSTTDVDYMIPDEGSLLWFDLLSIPKDAPHPSNAYLLINYLLEPRVIADITNHVGYANANRVALALVNASIASDDAIYPREGQDSQKLHAQSEYVPEQTRAVTRIWQRFKTGQ